MRYPGDPEYAALLAAMKHNPPACDGDDRFTQDAFFRSQENELHDICRNCHALSLCAEFARKSKPEIGYWAGRNYGETVEQKRSVA